MIPKRLITTWICSPTGDLFTDAHRALFERCLRSWLKLMPDYAWENDDMTKRKSSKSSVSVVSIAGTRLPVGSSPFISLGGNSTPGPRART